MAERWMRKALELAQAAALAGEVPVGAVVVQGARIIGEGCNRREATHDPTAHAEIQAIRQAAQTLGDWRLSGCDLYVTLEPCAMCAGAIRNSRLQRLFFGACDRKEGACGSVWMIPEAQTAGPNPPVQVYRGILEDECAALLQVFFQRRR